MQRHDKHDQTEKKLEFYNGAQSGISIFIGYFPAAIAFGLICRNTGLLFMDAFLFSVTNFAGASQFFAVNLIASGAAAAEVAVGVFLVNLRHLLMSASLSQRLETQHPLSRALIGFGNTDEVFSIASTRDGSLSAQYMAGIEIVSWSGWVSGTITGFLVGSVLPPGIQQSVGITLYAMFAALLVQEVKKEYRYLGVAALAAVINSILTYHTDISPGSSFVIAMTAASFAGIAVIPDDLNTQSSELSMKEEPAHD